MNKLISRVRVGGFLLGIAYLACYYQFIALFIISFFVGGCISELVELLGWTKALFLSFLWIGPTLHSIVQLTPVYAMHICILTSLFDIYQFICGRFFGRIRLTSISPKKTLEGYFGGLLLSIATVYLFGISLTINKLIVLYLASISGDLFASLIKRIYKIKDFSDSLESHGGFLDRADSILFSLPVYYYFLY